ncbi:uncharacterized protein (DUF1800 family) [Haloferula luteola]|uniref:Uncharacterized protein (DUF1800 family) n=1 Tax=Haloferula luteola TaxID=595692 RepID=A0A840VHH5_9BACT|nr:DUF1800 domain-containing protein [Haloferula luteola]MBB5353290.1 uncharacterized protein (DUF1800 family) [Haloferula luteola]
MLPQAPNDWTPDEAAHLMRRAGFGGSPREISRFHALGRKAAIESLLDPPDEEAAFPLPDWTDPDVARKEAREWAAERRKMRGEGAAQEEARRKFQREIRQQNQRRTVEMGGWWMDRILRTQAPLREKMVVFWHDHFATSAQKVRLPRLMMEQNQRFRRQAFGNFRALTHEMVKDPAMMIYLDTPSSRKGMPNENFAREVMELFTLGVGHYTEQDIREAARALTGYQLERLTGEVRHVPRRWDEGTKTVCGETGAFDGDQLVEVLFRQEAAASYLPAKLWSYFVEDEAPASLVKELAEGFRREDFQLRPLLREIFGSRAFYDSTVVRNQIKSPVQFLVQMARELELDQWPRGYALDASQQLGQVLFFPPNVAGWDWGRAWINTNTLLSRYNIAGTITKGAMDPEGGSDDMPMATDAERPRLAMLVKASVRRWKGPNYEEMAPRTLRENPEELVDRLIARFFHGDPGAKPRAAFIDYAQAKKGVVFTNHEVAELCHLMMSTPQYQLC